MNKKTRLLILLFCVILFSLIAPILIAYSEGYRFDFDKMEIVATGGIYVRTFPSADQITIDSTISQKPGFLGNSIFVQSLLPKNHTVSIDKNGYYSYSKTLPVLEKQVTKLENVLLFKNNIGFEIITPTATLPSPLAPTAKYIIKTNNLYYSDIKDNSTITPAKKLVPLIKKISAFALQNNNILWLGTDGFLYQSNLDNLLATPTKLTIAPLKIEKLGSYKIIAYNSNIFVNNNGSLLFLNTKTSSLDDFYGPVKGEIFSPDGKNIIYFGNKNITISLLTEKPIIKAPLYKSAEDILDCIWLNDDYIIVASLSKITILEIDYRGNVNTVTLPQSTTIANKKIDIKNPKILFDQQAGKLYVLTGDTLLLSEKIVP